jgi:glycosyltransferase involved in cell wall biosynthesis
MGGSGSRGRPRVALYLHRFQEDSPTGIHRYAIELATALAAAPSEFDLELMSGRSAATPATDFPMRLTHPIAPRRPLHLCWMLAGRPRFERVAGKLDLLHSLLPFAPIRSAAPQVSTIHDLLAIQHPEWHPGLVGDGIRRAIHFQSRNAAAIIAPSEVVAIELRSVLGVDPDRITVVPEAASGVFARPVRRQARELVADRYGGPDRRYLITVGAVSERKNLELLFAALAVLSGRMTDPPLLFVVGPDGIGAAGIHDGPKQHGVAHLVRFTGWVPSDVLAALMSDAVALTHPSWYEGFGLTPLEAMVAGIPVVASTRGSVPEVVGDAALLAEPDDPEAWATAIERMLAEPSMREDLIARGRARAAEFTWENTARLTLDVYRKVLE